MIRATKRFPLLYIVVFVLTQVVACRADSPKNLDISQPASNNVDLNGRALKKLGALFESSGLDSSSGNSGNVLKVNGIEMRVTLAVEHDSNRGSDFVFAARFETRLSGRIQKEFTVGSIGIGTSRDDAIETSIDEWVDLFGRSLVLLIEGKKRELVIGKYSAFPGATGFRGEVPTLGFFANEKTMHDAILRSLDKVIVQPEKDHVLLNLMISVDERGKVSGECRLDGVINDEGINALRNIKWPTGEGPYLFKQVYILERKN